MTAAGPAAVQSAADTQPAFKVSFTSFTAAGAHITPQPFRTRDGQRRTELVLRFTHLHVRGLCFSLRKHHLGTPYTVHITIPTLTATDLTVGVDSLDGLGVLGQQLNLRHLLSTADTPLSPPRQRGFLPIQVGNGLLSIGGTFRWVNARGFDVTHLALHAGSRQPECF
jgi:hypothetical protein